MHYILKTKTKKVLLQRATFKGYNIKVMNLQIKIPNLTLHYKFWSFRLQHF